jgi:ligand-binding sensor domain-containing protein
VSTGYDAAATTIVLATSEGSKFPSFPGNTFNLTWWNSTDYADPADDPTKEIIKVGARTGDTLSSITRGQEGTSAAAHNVSGKVYKVALCVTAKTIDDIEAVTTGLTKCAFAAGLAGTQSIPTAATKIEFVLITDDGGLFSDANHQFVATKAGLYFFEACVEAPCATGKVLNGQIRKNSTVVQESNSGILASTTMHRVQMFAMLSLAIADTVSVWTSHDNATNIDAESTNQRSYFCGFCVYNGT